MNILHLTAMLALVFSSFTMNAQKGILKKVAAKGEIVATNKISQAADVAIDKALDIFNKKNKIRENATPKVDSTATINRKLVIEGSGNFLHTEVSISNVSYNTLFALGDTLKSRQQVKDVKKSFADGLGNLHIVHSCTSDELLNALMNTIKGKFEVVDISPGKIMLKAN